MERARSPSPSQRWKWLVGSVLVLLGIAGLTVWASTRPGSVSFFMTPSDVAAKGESLDGRSIRVGGRVAPASLVRRGASVSFTETDGHGSVPIVYRGEIPDGLKERTDVVAEGSLRPDGTLAATRVMVKCSSRFVPKVERAARRASGR